jgi:hypothetical protein
MAADFESIPEIYVGNSSAIYTYIYIYIYSTRSGISTGWEGPVAPVPESVLPFRD